MQDRFLAGLASLIVTASIVPFCCKIAKRKQFVAIPGLNRWHKDATPLLGGAAMWMGLVFAGLIFENTFEMRWLLAGATLIFLTGLADDIFSLSPVAKIISLSVAILIPIFGIEGALTQHHIVDIFAEYLFILFFVNAYNLLDNMNGMAAGSALITSLLFIISDYSATPVSYMLYLLTGCLIGLLPYNFPKARIFMGDAGSMLIGYIISCSLIAGHIHENIISIGLKDLFFICTILIIPIADTLFVSITRILRRQKISTGGRDHISHRFARKYRSETMAVCSLWSFQTIIGILSLLVRNYYPDYQIAFCISLAAGIASAFIFLQRKTTAE
jgi:UDP-GlcNAc:undecaprenyl-phosphate GlcNAc-1-phosphate transferase